MKYMIMNMMHDHANQVHIQIYKKKIITRILRPLVT